MSDEHVTRTARVTLQIVGPMRRSTFQEEAPDPVAEVINDILHWSWSTRLQLRRFRESLRAEFDAWGLRPQVRARRHFSGTSYDEHTFLVAAGNLDRALRRAPKEMLREIGLSESWRRALWLLRNIYEHWDELRAAYRSRGGQLRGAAAKLRAEFPQADPWSFTFDPADGSIVIADVVPLGPLWKELRLLEARMLRLERRRKRQKDAAARENERVAQQ
jgi:hypothetical protein